MNGLLPEIRELKKTFPGKFIIPEEVKYEIIEKPMNIKRFELEALKLNELVEDEVLELPESLGISKEIISTQTKELLEIANKTFFEVNKKEIHLIDLGETACLVLSKILNKQEIPNVVIIDERTTRMLSEKPLNLKKLLQKKLHTRIDIKKENLKHFEGIKFARSAELIYIAYKKGIVRIKNKRVLDALLYALKFKGCAISTEEIEKIKKLG
jgi:predicted DNA-binding protein (UPF0251 family)